MEPLVLILALLEVFLTARYFSFAAIQWHLFLLRDSICIERFQQKQKAGDAIMASYNTTAAFTHLWGAVMLLSYIFCFGIPTTTIVLVTCIVSLLIILQTVCRYVVGSRYDLRRFYYNVLMAKLKEDVVGEENDYEVRYMKIYKEITNQVWWNVVWVAYIVSLCAFLLVLK